MLVIVKFVVKKIGMIEFMVDQVNDININLLLGISYLDMVLNNLEGLEILVIVGYNVGFGCLCIWCVILLCLVEGVIFVEIIFFNEIWGYVKNVMFNVIYYVVMFENCL